MSEAGFFANGSAVTFKKSKKVLSFEAARRGLDTTGDKLAIYRRLVQATEEGNDGAPFNCDTRNFNQLVNDIPKQKKKDPRKSLLCRLGLVVPEVPIEDFGDVRIPEKFICALTRKLVVDPVVAVDGLTYERVVIEKSFQDLPYGFDPVTAQAENNGITWQKSQNLFPAAYLKRDMLHWIDEKMKSPGLVPYPALVEVKPVSTEVIGKQPPKIIETRIDVDAYVRSNNPIYGVRDLDEAEHQLDGITDIYVGRGNDVIPTAHLIVPVGPPVLSVGRKMHIAALKVHGELREVLVLMQVQRYRAPRTAALLALNHHHHDQLQNKPSSGGGGGGGLIGGFLGGSKYHEDDESGSDNSLTDSDSDSEVMDLNDLMDNANTNGNKIQEGKKKKKNKDEVKTDRHNFLAVDCNLTVKEMKRYAPATHLTTVLGRTSDLEHCPGLVLEMRQRKEEKVKLGEGAYSTGKSATKIAENFQQEDANINDDADLKLDTEIEHEGLAVIYAAEEKYRSNSNLAALKHSVHLGFQHTLPAMSVNVLLKRHFLSVPHRLQIAHQMVQGMLSLKLLSKNRRVHGGLSLRSVLKEKFLFEYPTECLYSVSDYWCPWSAHLASGDPRTWPPELLSHVILSMARHGYGWKEACEKELHKYGKKVNHLKTIPNPHGKNQEKKGYYGNHDAIHDGGNATESEDVFIGWTSACDVWSVGMCLWELFSDGLTPYSGVDDDRAARLICGGDRPFKPDLMSDEVYELCMDCWMENPRARPTMEELAETMEGIASQSLAEFNLAVAVRVKPPEGDVPKLKPHHHPANYNYPHNKPIPDLFTSRPNSKIWHKKLEHAAKERGVEAQLDLLRMYGVRSSLGRESNQSDPTHAPYGEVAYRLRLMLKLLNQSKDKAVVIERLLFEYNGCIDALHMIGIHYENDEDIAHSIMSILLMIVIYGGGDGFKACLVKDGKLIELCTKLAWRNKSLRTRGFEIVHICFTILLLIVSPQPKQSAEVTENQFNTSNLPFPTTTNTAGHSNKPSLVATRAAALRCVEVEKKFSVSRWTCSVLRNLMSSEKSQQLPQLKRLLFVKDVISGAAGEKFGFQTERYEKRIEEEKLKMRLSRAKTERNGEESQSVDEFGHLLPNEPLDSDSRKIKPEEAEMLKLAETELVKAKLKFCDILCLGASLLQLQCSSSGKFYEDRRTEVAAGAYDRMPDWNMENVKHAQQSQNILNQKLMSAAQAGAYAKAASKYGQQVGWFNIDYRHSVSPNNHANHKPAVKASVVKPSNAKGGEWCTDDVRKDRMVFKLEVIEVLTFLLHTSETFLNAELAIQVLGSLRNLAQVSSNHKGRQLIIGETRKAALLGLLEASCLRLEPNEQMDGFEARKYDIYVQVQGGGVAVEMLPKLMKMFQKKSPKVCGACLAYLLALCGGAQDSGERVNLLFGKLSMWRPALATIAVYAPGHASEHLQRPPFVLTMVDKVDEADKKRGDPQSWLLEAMGQSSKHAKSKHQKDAEKEQDKQILELILSSTEKEKAIHEAIATACALLRSFAADIGPPHLVEVRRQKLMAEGAHLFIFSALVKFPNHAGIQCQGLGCLKNLTAGSNAHAEKRRDAMADCGLLAVIAKSASRQFVEDEEVDDDEEDDDGGVGVSLSKTGNKLSKRTSKKKRGTSYDSSLKMDQLSKAGVAAGAEALQVLRNIYDGADRERTAKEMADALSGSSFTSSINNVLSSITSSSHSKKQHLLIENQSKAQNGKPEGNLPVGSIPQGRLESMRRVLTPEQFDNLFFSPLESSPFSSSSSKGRSAKPREPQLPPPNNLTSLSKQTFSEVGKLNHALATTLQLEEASEEEEDGNGGSRRKDTMLAKKRFVAPKPLPQESSLVVDVASSGIATTMSTIQLARLAAVGTHHVGDKFGHVAGDVVTSTPGVVSEQYKQAAEASDSAIESVTSQLKTIFA